MIIEEKYKKILIKEFEKLLKRYRPQRINENTIIQHAVDDLGNKHKGIK